MLFPLSGTGALRGVPVAGSIRQRAPEWPQTSSMCASRTRRDYASVGTAAVYTPDGAVSPNSANLAWIAAIERFSLRLITGTGTPSRANSLSGTVNLIGSDRDKAQEGRSHERLCPSGNAGDRGPGLEGLGPGGSILDGGEVLAAEVEQVVDLIVSGEEALSLAG